MHYKKLFPHCIADCAMCIVQCMKNALLLVDDDLLRQFAKKGLAYKKPVYGLMPYVRLLKKCLHSILTLEGTSSVANY